jgi:hypothetical protein
VIAANELDLTFSIQRAHFAEMAIQVPVRDETTYDILHQAWQLVLGRRPGSTSS